METVVFVSVSDLLVRSCFCSDTKEGEVKCWRSRTIVFLVFQFSRLNFLIEIK